MKKGSVAVSIVAIILALVILGIFIINIALRECNSNRDCPDNAYCGSDYECHYYPKEIVYTKSAYLWPTIILGICLIVAAYIYRGGKIPFIRQ